MYRARLRDVPIFSKYLADGLFDNGVKDCCFGFDAAAQCLSIDCKRQVSVALLSPKPSFHFPHSTNLTHRSQPLDRYVFSIGALKSG